jgi:subtilisin family serine protease
VTKVRRGAVGVTALLALAVLLLAAAATNDEYRSQQWALDRIGADQAWTVARGQGQVIAVIDSGLDLEHPDLVDRIFRRDGVIVGKDYVDGDNVPQDALGHGTMVAGVIAAATDNGIGIAAVAPDALLMPIRVLDEEGKGDLADVEDAIDWAVDNGATVINLSLETVIRDNDGGTNTGLGAPVRAVQDAWNRGVVVVAAAGNSGNPFTDYPPTSPVVLVGATDRQDERADFSDTGRTDMVMAPGVDIVSTWCRPDQDTPCDGQTHKYGIAKGTSFASPHVSGAIAILRSSGLNHQQAVQRLRETARDIGPEGRDLETGYGLIDLVAATGATGGTPSPSPDPSPSSSPTPSPTTTPASTDQPSTAPSNTPTVTPTPTVPDDPEPTVPPSTPPPSEPEPAPIPSVSEAPDPSADPVDPRPARGPWSALAAALVAATAVLHGQAAVRRRDA